ncbi:WD repeat-containing protein 48 [Phakopsora pachyrhizi]|nr:WD repeat-containing protein 48 [Phakopsora pachyrhizi]
MHICGYFTCCSTHLVSRGLPSSVKYLAAVLLIPVYSSYSFPRGRSCHPVSAIRPVESERISPVVKIVRAGDLSPTRTPVDPLVEWVLLDEEVEGWTVTQLDAVVGRFHRVIEARGRVKRRLAGESFRTSGGRFFPSKPTGETTGTITVTTAITSHQSRDHDPRPLIIKISSAVSQPSPSSSSSPSSPPKLPTPPSTKTLDEKVTRNQQPRHCLGVNALALDLSTVIQSRGGPEGILYTAGKDGLVAAWELGLPTVRRQVDEPDRTGDRPGELIDDPLTSKPNSPVRSREVESSGAEGWRLPKSLDLYESRHRLDRTALDQITPPPTTLRQCVQSHTDWCNDIVLCNYNQTLISASSDRTLKAWFPHSPHLALSPSTIGSHSDYVKCLAHSRDQGWVASAGLDRRIKVWDIAESRLNPVVNFSSDSNASSIYSLATTLAGTILAAGSPSRTVGLYDPRIPSRFAELVGHTDNVRAILLSNDGSHLLSASSDATVKLWEVGMRRCLYTFSHHSASVWSLFSDHPRLQVFHSGDRAGYVCKIDLEDCGDLGEGECVVLCKVGPDEETPDLSMAGSENVVRITGADDTYIWTATGSSSVQRWSDVPTRRQRRKLASLRSIKIPDSANYPTTQHSTSRPPSYNTAPDTCARPPQLSSTNQNLTRSPSSSGSDTRQSSKPRSKSPTPPLATSPNLSSQEERQKNSVFYDGKMDEVPLDALVPLVSPSDPIPRQFVNVVNVHGQTLELAPTPSAASLHSSISMARSPTKSRFGIHPSSHAPSPDFIGISSLPKFSPIYVESQSEHGSKKATLEAFSLKSLSPEDQRALKLYKMRDSATGCVPLRGSPDAIIAGRSGLLLCELLNDRRHVITSDTTGEVALWDIICGACVGVFAIMSDSFSSDPCSMTPTTVLRAIRDRIEGEASTETWCSVETQAGLLTVHLEEPRCFDAEIFADEANLPTNVLEGMKEDHRISLGKWVIRNLFDGFVSHHAQLRANEETAKLLLEGVSNGSVSTKPLSPPETYRGLNRTQRSLSHSDVLLLASNEAQTHSKFGSPCANVSSLSNRRDNPLSRTPGMTISLATPASTPIVPPDFKVPSMRLKPFSEAAIILGTPQGPAPALKPGSRTNSCDDFALPSVDERSDEERSDKQRHLNRLTTTAPRSDGGSSRSSLLNRPTLNSVRRSSYDGPLKGSISNHQLDTLNGIGSNNLSASSNMSLSGTVGIFTRFKALGRGPKRKTSGDAGCHPVISKPIPKISEAESQDLNEVFHSQKNLEILLHKRKIVQEILSRPFSPIDSSDAPRLDLSPDTTILISEASDDSGAWEVTYRGLVSTTEEDSETLESMAPGWLLEFLLGNRTISRDGSLTKVTFVLQPEGGKEVAGINELPNGQERKADSIKGFKVAKSFSLCCAKVGVRLDKNHESFPNEGEAEKGGSHYEGEGGCEFKVEKEIELICNGVSLPWSMSLGAVKQWVWCKGGDVVIGYRWKREP